MKNLLIIGSIFFLTSCSTVGYNISKRTKNNSFSVKVENVDGCTLSTPKIKEEKATIQLNQNEKVTITLKNLNKKNRQLLISHPEYENQLVTIKKTPRIGSLILDIVASPLLLGLPIIIDPFKSDFYKVSKNSKEINVNLRISKEGINQKIKKCNDNLDIEEYKKLTTEFPYMFDSQKIHSDISKLVNQKLIKSIDEPNLTTYTEIIKTYRNYVDTNRIQNDISTINKNLKNTNTSDKISSFLKQNCETALYMDLNESNKNLLFNYTNLEKLNSSNITFVEDRFFAQNRALKLSSCPPINLKTNYKSNNTDFSFGFWCKPLKNEPYQLLIKSENLKVKLEGSLIEIITLKENKTIKLPTSLIEGDWNYIYFYFDNDKNPRYEDISHLKFFINDKSYSSDFITSFTRPSNIVLEGNGNIDEFAVFHEMSKSVDWVRNMDESKMDQYLLEKRLAKEAEDKREMERLAKIQRLKEEGIDWIVDHCWSKTTKDGKDGSKFMSSDETYCFEENGICIYKTGFYEMPAYVNKNIPLYLQNHLARYKVDQGTQYSWKLNSTKSELIIFFKDNEGNIYEKKQMQVNQNTKKIDWQ